MAARPLTLCYHAVSESWPHQLAVTPGAFEEQVRHLLRRGYAPATAEEVATGRGRVFHVTFDDAFRNVWGVVDVMEALGVRATVFAVAELAETGGAFDRGDLRAEVDAGEPEIATMGWEALRELRARGVEVGSHTVSHPRLSQLDDADLRRELVDSRERLEDELRAPCPWLAYPFGDEGARVRLAAREAGYRGAFSLPGRPDPHDPFGLPRVGVYRKDTSARFRFKVSPVGRRIVARGA